MKIIFVGNSYTYCSDMPKLTEALLNENGICATVDSVTAGGRRLYENVGEDELAKKLLALSKSTEYDIALLQEQSYFPLVKRDAFLRGVADVKERIDAKRTLLYVTWGRGDGCELLTEHGWTRESMTRDLYTAYAEAARLTGSELSDVGRAFFVCRELYPSAELYTEDLSHPTLFGTALGCSVHFKTITGALPKSTTSLGITDEQRLMIEATLNKIYHNV